MPRSELMAFMQPLCWRPDLRVTATSDADGRCVHVEDRVRGKFFRIGEAEFALLARFDGVKPWSEVARDANQSLGQQAFGDVEVQAIIQWGLQHQLLTMGMADGVPQSSAEPSDSASRARWSLLSIRVPLGCPDALCAKLLPWFGCLFGTPAFFVWLILVGLAVSDAFVAWDRFQAAVSEMFVPANWFGLGVAWLMLKVIHESAHAIVCKRHGGEVREVGVALILFAPVAYVDVTSCWRFASRWPRIHTALAGMYAEVACASLAVLLAGQTASLETQVFLDNVAVMAGVTTLLFNLNPLSRFDGYYVLADLCRVPNLYARGRTAARQFWGRWIGGRGRSSASHSWSLIAYGTATWLWMLSVMLGVVAASSLYWHGFGLVLSAVIAVSWLGPIFVREARGVARWTNGERFGLALRASVLLASSVLLLALAPWPFGSRAPGVVEFSPLSVVRADADGFVNRVLVAEGEFVAEGQPLLELRNHELERELRDLELTIEQSRLRERLAVEQHDTAGSQVEQQQRDALQRRRAEKEQQVDRLTIRAPIAGVVLGRQLAALGGAFVTEGHELLSIGDPSHREFIAAVRQEDLPAAQAQQTSPVSVHLIGRGDVGGRVRRIRPRASTTPEHLGLCAPFGGPLAVQTRDEDVHGNRRTTGFELLEPQFWITISLDDSAGSAPFAGETGVLRLSQQRSCAEELWIRLSKWLRRLSQEPAVTADARATY